MSSTMHYQNQNTISQIIDPSISQIDLNIYVSLTPYTQYNVQTFTHSHIPVQKITFPSNVPISEMKNIIQRHHNAFGKIQPEAKAKLTQYMELFMADEDRDLTKGIWLESSKMIDHYMVRSGGILYYQDVRRILVVKMLDLSKKSVEVIDSYTVHAMMQTICQKCGIANYDEYSLARNKASKEDLKKYDSTLRSASGTTPLRQASSSTLLKQHNSNVRNSSSNASLNGTLNSKSGNGTLVDGGSINTTDRGGIMDTIRNRSLAQHDKKYSKYRENLTTDEDFNWLNPVQTLREQGVQDNEELILRRRYFYSDQYIEESDPKQLKLLYEQCKEGILGGTQVIAQQAASAHTSVEKLAACQTFIEYGPYIQGKNLDSALEKKWHMKDFIPQEFMKEKHLKRTSIEKYKSLRYQHKFKAMNDYVKICREMPTYGITFYLVKEKLRGRNKLVTRLFGVSKSKCLSMDPKNKEITYSWKLEHIKKWAASSNSFMLDFGEHHDLYAIRTSEGEQIAQLLAGYIDIILKNRQLSDKFPPADFEMRGIEQGQVVQGVGRKIQRNQGAQRNQAVSSNMAQEISMSSQDPQSANYGQIPSGLAQKGSVTNYGTKRRAILEHFMPIIEDNRNKLNKDLVSNEDLNLTNDTISPIHQAMTHICGILSPIPDLISSQNQDSQALALSTMTSNLEGLTEATRDIARHWGDSDDNSRNLLRAAEDVMNAMQDLISSTSKQYDINGEEILKKNATFPEASKLAQAANALLDVIGANEHPDFNDTLEQRTKEVATRTAQLVKIARNVSQECRDGHDKSAIITAATDIALDTSRLVTIVRALIPVAEHQDIYKPVEIASNSVQHSCEQFKTVALASIGPENKEMQNIDIAAMGVSESLQRLLEAIKSGPITYEYQQIIEAGQNLVSQPDNMQSNAKSLTDATTNLVSLLKLEANFESNLPKHDFLLQTAKDLADATKAMVMAAKARHDDLENTGSHTDNLNKAGRDLQSAAEKADQARSTLGAQLIIAANRAAICSTQLTTSAKSAMSEWPEDKKNSPVGKNLLETCSFLVNETKELVNAIRRTKNACDHVKTFSELERFRRSIYLFNLFQHFIAK